MLNRLYIVVGVLAILAIAAAYFVPRFVEWGDYRDRMEALASEVIGAPVTIAGDIEFVLLPQPQLSFTDVRVGDADVPVATVSEVQAQFSLVEFLRDRYHITQLVLESPAISARIDTDGRIAAGFGQRVEGANSTVSVASARIVSGSAGLLDERSGARQELQHIEGELRIETLRGPFSFQGTAIHDGTSYRGRITTSTVDENGDAQLSLLVAPTDESYVVTAEGHFAGGDVPAFDGSLTYRRVPPVDPASARDEDIGRGPLAITGKVQANPARILLSDYTIVPDENRPATRLTGAADVTLGADQRFNAVISGGIVALPPRSATADPATLPYEIVRLLGDLPAPPVPGLAGTVGIDIAEVNLRALSLRNLRVDATSDGEGWQVDLLTAQLPGSGSLVLDGRLSAVEGRPEFGGTVKVTAPRLDALVQLWKPHGDNVLFGMHAEMSARVALVGQTLSLGGGIVDVGGARHVFASEVGFAPVDRHLHLNATLGAMTAEQSTALAALLPDIAGNGRFGATFSRARFDVTASEATVLGLAGRDLAAAGTWEGGVLSFDRLAGELGGVRFDAELTAFGTVARPELSGRMRVAVADGSAPGLNRLYDTMAAPEPLRAWLDRSLPADLELGLDPPTGDGGQDVHVTGSTGAADVKLDASLGAGFLRAFGGPISARLDAHATDTAAFTSQLGLGHSSLTPEHEPVRLVAVIDGNAVNSFATTVRIEGGRDSLGFSGNVVVANLQSVSGNGALQVALGNAVALSEAFGAEGVSLPPVNGSARLEFVGLDTIRIDQIAVNSGGERASGSLKFAREGGTASITGTLNLGTITPSALLSAVGGRPATEPDAETAPGGRFDLGGAPRATNGRIEIAANRIAIGDREIVSEPSLVLSWDATATRLREFRGRIGDGSFTAEIGLCCAGNLAHKELSGRITLSDVAVADLVSTPLSDAISGKVDVSARFSGTGDTLAAVVAAMTGEGSFTLGGLSIAGLSPEAFNAVTSLDEVLDLEPDVVTGRVVERLESGAFSAADVHGGFTIAGGVLRSPNLAIESDAARLFGGATLRLADLGLGGSFAMSPTVPAGPEGMLVDGNAQIVASLGGTLDSPRASFDVTGMVDSIMVRAYELEVARLERLRAEEEARLAAAAEERRRIAEEEAARRAAEEEAARQAAEEEAARQAAEEEAARRAAEEANAAVPPGGITLQPGFNLDLPPANSF